MLLLFSRFLPLSLRSLSGTLFFCGEDSDCGSEATLWLTVPSVAFEAWLRILFADVGVLSACFCLPECIVSSLLMLFHTCGVPVFLRDCSAPDMLAELLGSR